MSNVIVNVGDVFKNKYGEYKVLSKVAGKTKVKFLETGFECEFYDVIIRKNQAKDYMVPTVDGVGYYGAPTVNDQDPVKLAITKLWLGMIHRCYRVGYSEDRPAYAGCSVASEWHNLQNFKSWVIEQMNLDFYQEGWELDKDLLVRGNKIYGPNTCVFLPSRLNQLQQVKKNSTYNYLPGVNFDKEKGKFKAEVNFDGKRYYLPRKFSELECFLDYKELKERLVQADAENWKGKIHPKAYESLKNYSLDWILEEYLDG